MGSQPDLTVQDVADLLQTHPETIRRWLRKGLFPNAYQISNRYGWRIPSRDVQALRAPRSVKADKG